MGRIQESVIQLPVLHEAQREIHDNRGRFNTLCLGRRLGKTLYCTSLLIDDPDRPNRSLLDGCNVAFYSGTSKTFKEVWRTMCAVCEPITTHRSEQDYRLEVMSPTGRPGVFECWSLYDGGERSGAGVGRRYHRVVVDEAAFIKDLMGIWLEYIRPTLIDYRGDAYFISTPKGKLNDFYEFFRRGLPENREIFPEYRSFQMPSHRNPYLSQAELDGLKAEYSGRDLLYQQEILAQFVAAAGLVFDTAWINELPAARWPKLGPVYQAWDWAAKEKQVVGDDPDWSVGGCGGLDAAGRFCLQSVRRGRWAPGRLVEEILDYASGSNPRPAAIYVEHAGAAGLMLEDMIRRRMRERGLSFRVDLVVSSKDKVTRAAVPAAEMQRGNFYVPEGAAWLGDFKAELAEFPGAKHDDQVDMISLLNGQVAKMREGQVGEPKVERMPGRIYHDQFLADQEAKRQAMSRRGRRRR
jgi:predicted phage terminase large subunit-like protein